MKNSSLFSTGLLRNAAAAGLVIAAGFLGREVLNKGWELATGEEPPLDPADVDTDWREAVAWTVCLGVVMGLSRLAAQRGTHGLSHRRSRLPSRRLRARVS